MPCRSDYQVPTEREQNNKRAARLLVYIYKTTGKGKLPWAEKAANDYYGNWSEIGDLPTIELCRVMRDMSEEERERIAYNAHEPVSRDLADWWEDHQKADRRREEQEKEAVDREIESLKARLAELERRVTV